MNLSILDTARGLAQSHTVGAFIDESLRRLEESFAGSLVSFNRIDLARRTGRPPSGPTAPNSTRSWMGWACWTSTALPVVHLAARLVAGADQ